MQTESRAVSLRAIVRGWRSRGESVAFVPTMGNLHAGHYSLIRLARERWDHVLASVFVNPTQFGPDEDYERYPRSLEADRVGLAEQGCELLFVPDVDSMYPFGAAQSVRVHVPQLTGQLEGAHRPGHFDGVTTVVSKLFNLVQPDVAVFGRKDYQQLRVVERMCRDLCLPVDIVAAPIVRDHDGLALSSRNQYLDASQRAAAPRIHASLEKMRERLHQGQTSDEIEQACADSLTADGFVVDYVAIRRAGDLSPSAPDQREGLVALIAASLGRTRLIDNLDMD